MIIPRTWVPRKDFVPIEDIRLFHLFRDLDKTVPHVKMLFEKMTTQQRKRANQAAVNGRMAAAFAKKIGGSHA